MDKQYKSLNTIIESGKGTAEWLQTQLKDLNEDCLYNKELKQNSIIYRFTWLRSFHHPIAIRIEKTENEIMLYWKVGKGAGGYELGCSIEPTKMLTVSFKFRE